MTFYKIALLLPFILQLGSAQSTYYVTPTPDTPCPGEPCLSFVEHTRQGSGHLDNATLVFLPGTHTIESSIEIGNLTSLTLLGDSSSPTRQVTSRIVCSQPASVSFQYIERLIINTLGIVSCGFDDYADGYYGAAMVARSVQNLIISNCLFQNNTNLYGFKGGALAVVSSSLTISQTMFERNFAFYDGGSVHIQYNSAANFTGNQFKNNKARYGGGVALATDSVGYFTENVFMNNVARFGGGIDVYSNSTANLLNNTFVNNIAAVDGGAVIDESESSVEFNGNLFIDNSATRSGGGVIIQDNSTADFTDNTFTNNSNSNTWEVEIDTTSMATFINNNFINSAGYAIYGNTNNTPSTYYITPLPDTLCPESPCHTLSEYLRLADQYFTLNTTLVLLPGDHLLENKLLIRDISALTLIGGMADGDSSRSLSATATRIICTSGSRTVFFRFQNIYEVDINAVEFMSCGNASFSAMSMLALFHASISNCMFQNSTGRALYVKQTDSLVLTRNSFVDNFSPTVGGGIHVFSVNDAILTSNSFTGNLASGSGGAIDMLSSTAIFKGNNTFLRNSVNGSGGAMFIGDSTVHFSGKTHFTTNSGQLFGGAIAIVNSTVSYSGNTTFVSNTANSGGAVYAEQCRLSFEGDNIFKKNTAFSDGGGLLLTSDSKYYLHPNTIVSFANNTAMQNGGAIKVDVSNLLVYCRTASLSSVLNECFFQLNSTTNTSIKSYAQLNEFNVRMHFKNNAAGEGGSDIYGGAVDNCRLQSVDTECCDFQSSGNVLDCIITGNCYTVHETLDVSSDPLGVYECENNVPNYGSSSITKRAYPGGKFTVSMIALGQRDGNVSAVIQADLTQNNIEFDPLQYKQNTKNTCTDIEYTVFSLVEQPQEDITLYALGPCPREGRSLELRVEILQKCPPGFERSRNRRVCVCSSRLEEFTDTCVIEDGVNGTILRPRDASFWVGYSTESDGLILHPHCPFDYCNSAKELYVSADNSDMQCSYSRTGKLCGKCIQNLSLVLGSSRCLPCSNSHLTLLAAFTFAGIALVFFLFLLKLTVAVGTINGLIFYANVVQVNSALFFQPGTANILTVFIAWLNLDLGIETCFYDGMNAYAKTWLQFLFPVYVWTLVGIIILFSHFSQMISNLLGRNPIAVLCTLFLLSYAKVLRTIIAALSFAVLEYPNHHQTVWLYDGNVKYFTHGHIPLFLVALSTLLFLFLPYSLLLFCGQWLQSMSDSRVFSWINKPAIKSILDAYHAPYAGKHRYWTGLLLLTRFVLFLIFAFNALRDPDVNLFCITTVTLAIITIGFVAGKIYSNRYLGALEASFIINLGILAAATTSEFARSNQAALTYTSISIAFATFIGIVVYHSYSQLKDTRLLNKLANTTLDAFRRRKKHSLNVEDHGKELIPSTQSVVSLREPLLEDDL